MAMKPLYAKPQLYAHYFFALKEIALSFGYNLVLHGSMNRDLDLIAIPWVDNPQTELRLIQALDHALTGKCDETENAFKHYYFSVLPGGRHNYVIDLNRGGYFEGKDEHGIPNYAPDPQYYIDISFTPQCTKD